MAGGKAKFKGRLARTSKELRQEQSAGKPGKKSLKARVGRGKQAKKKKVMAGRPGRGGKRAAVSPPRPEKPARITKPEPDEKEVREKVERSKQLIIVTGVSFFMLAILFVWFLSLRHNLKTAGQNLRQDEGLADVWQDLNDNIRSQMDEIRQGLDEAAALGAPSVLGSDISTGTEGLAGSGPAAADATGTAPSLEDREARIKSIMENIIENKGSD